MALTGCRLQGRRHHHLCEPFLWAGSLPTSSCLAPRLGRQSVPQKAAALDPGHGSLAFKHREGPVVLRKPRRLRVVPQLRRGRAGMQTQATELQRPHGEAGPGSKGNWPQILALPFLRV